MTAGELGLEFRPVTPDRWDDMVELFERKGPRGGTPATQHCFCMWWRERTYNGAQNKKAMQKIVASGQVPGLIAYLDGEAVGWVSIAPRVEHPQVINSPSYKPPNPEDEGVFSITCFYVYPTHKKQGIAKAMLRAAVDYAASRGATAVEAYPAEKLSGTSSPDFMGAKSWFLAEGFVPDRPARGKTIVRYDLS